MKVNKLFLISVAIIFLTACAPSSDNKKENNDPQHVHQWSEVTYVWSDDYASCAAERVCELDSTHKEEETVQSSYEVTQEATCEWHGTGRYIATFKNKSFSTQYHEIELSEIGHDWGTPTYTWSENNSTCTAKTICLNNPEHIITQTVNSSYQLINNATCTEDGLEQYTAVFTNSLFSNQVKQISLDHLNHDWGTPTISWSYNNDECTATVVCKNDSSHVVTETVQTEYEIAEESTYEKNGTGVYTANFTKVDYFSTQIKEVKLPLKNTLNKLEYYYYGNDKNSYFVGCKSDAVGEVYVPANINGLPVESIGGTDVSQYSFRNNKGVTNVIIGYGPSRIGEKAFEGCTNLKSITIPQSVRYICDNAFSGCTSLERIVLPKYLESIGTSAFSNCENLKEVCFEDGSALTTLPQNLFLNCSSLTTVNIPNGVTIIPERTFENCTSLESITIPNLVTHIRNNAFKGCSSLAEVNGGESITHILLDAFSNCASLEAFNIGKNVSYIENPFNGCSKLLSITVDQENNAFVSLNNVVYSKDLTKLILCLDTSEGEFVVPNGVTTIYYYAFINCTKIPSIDFGNSLEEICGYAFYNCINLASLNFPNTLKKIGRYAFYNCIKLEELFVTLNVNTISSYAFGNCAALTIVNSELNSNVELKIESNAFNNCTSLIEVSLYNANSVNGFGGCTDLYSLHFGNNVQTIGNYAFADCSKLHDITCGDNVQTIDADAFKNCSNLTDVHFGNNVQTIGSYAFSCCSSLNYNLPDSIVSIGFRSFYNCTSMTEASIGPNVATISDEAFAGCTSLERFVVSEENTKYFSINDALYETSYSTFKSLLYFPAGNQSILSLNLSSQVSSIKNNAFKSAQYLETVSINSTSSRFGIGEYAFYGAIKLKSVSINASNYKTINLSTFRDCTSLQIINLPKSVTRICSYAFENCTKLLSIHYASTKADFKQHVTLDTNWRANSAISTVHCSDGDIQL